MLAANARAQNVLALKEKIGDKYFRNLGFMQAIATYEDILKEDSTNTRVLPNLATSYRKIYDTDNAERVYAKLVTLEPSNEVYVLAYAQLLAINKKYPESAKQYERYSFLNPMDQRSAAFASAYEDEIILTKESKVNVSIANFNSGQSDFSPAFFKQGLVFVSNRSYSTAIKRTFEWDQSFYLNLYYIPDTASIKKVNKTDTADGKSKRRKIYYNDDDTRFTSNDSRTMGAISYKYVDTSNMFVTPAVIVYDFSKKIKTKYHEGPVTFTADEKTIIFTRNNYNKGRARRSKDGINKLKLYSAHINDDGKWTNVKSLNINNNNYSIGHPSLAPGDTILYFASDMPGGYGGTDLYRSYWKDNKWNTPENLGPQINTPGKEQFPYIAKDGMLYFSSDGHPGIGGLDLFKTSLTHINIENMGIPVNSSFDDFGIVLDQSTINGFFSSNRRRGVNDDDIYLISIDKPTPYTIKIVDSLSQELIAVSKVIVQDNSNQTIGTDSSLTGLFHAQLWDQSTYRFNAAAMGYRGKTISQITDRKNPIIVIPLVKMKEGCIVAGTITNKDSKLPIAGAHIIIIQKQTKDTLFNYTVGENGKYLYAGLKGYTAYEMLVWKEGYFSKPSIVLSTNGNKCISATPKEYDYLKDFELEQIVLGKAIKIENIYFDLAKYNIRKDAAKELDKIVKLMVDNPDIIIELSSHTDCRASYAYNMKLSDNRAKSSAAYIISKGIPETRITGKGYGETMLVNDCACEGKIVARTCSEEEHQANRRTEFKVTGFLSDINTQLLNDGRGTTPSAVPLPTPNTN
jgi:outer membrane protein OmpA-like peptidoglycan-associated protein/tetratricopeptide (TPR) repeat protein